MTQEELTTKIIELNFKRMQAWKSRNYNYDFQLKELVSKLKSDLAFLNSKNQF